MIALDAFTVHRQDTPGKSAHFGRQGTRESGIVQFQGGQGRQVTPSGRNRPIKPRIVRKSQCVELGEPAEALQEESSIGIIIARGEGVIVQCQTT